MNSCKTLDPTGFAPRRMALRVAAAALVAFPLPPRQLNEGVYFLTMRAGALQQTQRIVVLR